MAESKRSWAAAIRAWIGSAVASVAKSGAAAEAWRFIGPAVLALMASSATFLIGLVTQAPLLASIAVAALVFVAVAVGVERIQALRARSSAPPLEVPRPDERPGLGASLERLEDVLSHGITIRPDPIGDALRRMADRPPPSPRRDTSLAEAMLYILRGRWGLDFSGFDPHTDSYDLETIKWQFEERAEEGHIQVWGSEIWVEGRYRKIGAGDWQHLKIHWESLIEGKPRTTAKDDNGPNLEPRYNLMVNKAQIEREFRRAPVSNPSSARPSEVGSRDATRRALIAKGRDVVIRFRRSGEQGFEQFASRDRDYLDIQPHLGEKYQVERSRAADRIIYGPEHDELRVAALLQELSRLQKEWNLD